MKEELDFLSGRFFEYEIPKSKEFLLKYFKKPMEREFVRYYLCFGTTANFADNAGVRCSRAKARLLKKRLETLVKVHKEAKDNIELELLTQIEMGKYKIR